MLVDSGMGKEDIIPWMKGLISGEIYTFAVVFKGVSRVICFFRSENALPGINFLFFESKQQDVKPYTIGITGGSGSGKTSFISSLKEYFDQSELCVVSQDDYYLPKEKQYRDNNGICNYDLPTSVDLNALVEDVKKLKGGEVVRRREYTFNNPDKKSEWLTFRPAPVLLIEGLFIFAEADLFRNFDLSIFVHAKENLKVIRRIKRDQLERNYPLDDVLYRYQNHVLPAFEKFIAPFREEADIVINNNKDFNAALDVMQAVIESKNKLALSGK